MDINHLITLLVEDVKQVIEWIDTHGEGFLNKHVGVGRNLQKTRALQSSYEHFDKVAQNTYTNAGKLLGAAHELAQTGTCDSREMCQLASDLDARIQQFAQKVERRKSLLNQVVNFYRDEVHVSQRLEQFKQLLIVIEASSLQCPDSIESARDAIVQLDNKKKNIFNQVRKIVEQSQAILEQLRQRAMDLTKGEPLAKYVMSTTNSHSNLSVTSSSATTPSGRPYSTSSQSSQASSTSSAHFNQTPSSGNLFRHSASGSNTSAQTSNNGITSHNNQLIDYNLLNQSKQDLHHHHQHNHHHHHQSAPSGGHAVNISQPLPNHSTQQHSQQQQQSSSLSSAGGVPQNLQQSSTGSTATSDQSTTPTTNQAPSSNNNPLNSLIASMQAIENIVNRLTEDLKKTEDYYNRHRKALDLCLQLKIYEKDVLDASHQLDMTIEEVQNTAQKLPDIQNVDSGEKLLKLHNTTSKKLRELVFTIIKKGQEVMEDLKRSHCGIVIDNDQNAVDQISMLVDYMDQRAQEADELAECRRMHIEYSIKFRQFELDAQQVQSWIRKGESMLIASFHIPLSLKEAEELRASHEKFQQAFERSHASTLQFKQRAQALIQADYFEEDSINQITAEVESMWQQLMTHAEDRFKLIKGAINFYKTSDKVREVLESLENDYQMEEDYCGIERYVNKPVAECLKDAALQESRTRPQSMNSKWTGNNLTLLIQQQQAKHREQKEAFLKGCTLVRRKAEAFLKYSARCADRTYTTTGNSDAPKSLIKNAESRVKSELEIILKQENRVLGFWSMRKTQIDHCQQFALVENCACHLLEWIRQNSEVISSKQGTVRYEQFREFESSFKGTEDAVRKIYQESYSVIERGHSHAAVLQQCVEYLDAKFKDFVKRYEDYKSTYFLDKQPIDKQRSSAELAKLSSGKSTTTSSSHTIDSIDSGLSSSQRNQQIQQQPQHNRHLSYQSNHRSQPPISNVHSQPPPLTASKTSTSQNAGQNKDRNSDSGVEGDSISSKDTSSDICSSATSNNWISQYNAQQKASRAINDLHLSSTPAVANNHHLNHNNNNVIVADDHTVKAQQLSILSEQKRKSLTKKEHGQKVMKELLDTERNYVQDLEACIQVYLRGYREAGQRLPSGIKDKESVIFGNIEDIYRFHKNTFLKELEKYESMPEDVGHCFVTWAKSFDVYVEYCKKQPESNQLIVQYGSTFFNDLKQRNQVKHPVSAYLIKPVQRITKYQLMLKDLLQSCDENEIKDALDVMVSVPKKLNDAMHLDMLVGCDIQPSVLGEVILQDKFQVTEPKSLLRKTRERRIFLFEFYLVFAKEVKVESSQQISHYQFKSKIMLSDIISILECGSGSSSSTTTTTTTTTTQTSSALSSSSSNGHSNGNCNINNNNTSNNNSSHSSAANQSKENQHPSSDAESQSSRSTAASSAMNVGSASALVSGETKNDGTKFVLIHCNKSLKSRDSTCKIILKADKVETKNLWVKTHRELLAESNFRPFGEESSSSTSSSAAAAGASSVVAAGEGMKKT